MSAIRCRSSRWALAVVLAAAACGVLPTAAGAAPAPVPCTPSGGGRHTCQFYVPGDGRTGGAPVQGADGRVVGYLHQGANWVVCQETGGRVTSGQHHNDKWAWTLADNLRWGWVNAVYARGGDNDGGFGGVPGCGGAHGRPPGLAALAPAPAPPPAPGAAEPAPAPAPAPAQPAWRSCRSPWMSRAQGHDEPQGWKVSFVPTKRARYAARGTPGAYADMWGDLRRCVPFPSIGEARLNSMFKQMVCHALYGVGNLGGRTWDFESWRPDISSVKALRIEGHSCNWGREAWTDTTKCVQLRLNPSTCISVHGGGLDVGSVRLGVRLNSRQTSYGHWQLWIPGQPENTNELLMDNRSFLGKIVWGPRLAVDRAFAHGTRLCTTWWRNDAPGRNRWSDHGRACVTITR
ncbi:MAG TPA: DUF2599 domain-containing protein [Solirubrobacteraceae bacterium]|nr:DUF2599 domain-containing protein [Solirubrobacteraceae bacterium]